MKPFLYKIAETFYREYADGISEIAFVFPNRRAGVFFQKYLSEIAGKSLFSPPIFTINDLFVQLTDYTPADRIGMLFLLYENYKRRSKADESFDDFVFWGEMLLNDFDDVDKYLVDARQLFSNIQELKEIDDAFDYLSPEQLAAIHRFWENFIPGTGSQKKEEFIALWEILYALYTDLREDLRKKHMAYEGMIFREVAEKARAGEELNIPYDRLVFVGLNALTTAEEVFLKRLSKMGIADFYWDYDAPALKDDYNKAAHFVLKNRIAFPSKLSLDDDDGIVAPVFELIGIPSAVGQAKQVQQILSDLLDSKSISNPEQAINTAVVLPDERLLLPMLYSVPEEIAPINVTMGYTLSSTPIAGLMEAVFDLQNHLRMVKGEIQFYHRKVLLLLSHRYIQSTGKKEVIGLSDTIKKYNKVFISASELCVNPLLTLLFRPLSDSFQAADYLINLLEYLQQDIPEPEDEQERMDFSALEKEFFYYYYITVKRLKEVMTQYDTPMSVSTFFRLLSKMTASISIPFRGEPLSGLQIMGVLETRALDFENLIILSMNEGVFPLRKVANSFIPYNLRKGFGMATTEHQDSIYAYYFYRMVYRAKKVYMLYDTRAEGLQSGEVSRFVYQLRYHYQVPIDEKLITYNIAVNETPSISIPKTEQVVSRLADYLSGGTRSLSASAINIYIDCPFRFYLRYVEGVMAEDEVTETIESGTFGSIYHGVMESVYQRLSNSLVTADLLEKMRKNNALLTSYIEQGFARYYYNTKETRSLTGQNFLVGEIIRKYVKQTLLLDSRLTPFRYIESEKRVEIEWPFDEKRKVRLKAFIDRIDEKEGKIRIIDYKTGSGKLIFKSMDDLFDKKANDRPKAVMQVFMYSMMYQAETPGVPIFPGIYFLRNLFTEKYDCGVQYRPERVLLQVDDYREFDREFKEAFNACVGEIFDSSVPFFQTQDYKKCQYCEFTALCKRQEKI